MEIKNKLTVTRGEEGGITEKIRRKVKSRKMYRGPMGTDRGVRIDCGIWGRTGVGGAGKSNGKNVGQL